MIVSFSSHTHFFDQTHMTFRTHLALTFTFVGIIALHSLNWLEIKDQITLFRNSILANSTYPDAAFDQRLHCLLRQTRSSVKEYVFSENVTRYPSIYAIICHRLLY